MRLVEKIGLDLGSLVDVEVAEGLQVASKHEYAAVEIMGDESLSDRGNRGIWPWEKEIWQAIKPLLDEISFKAYHAPYEGLNFLTLNPGLRDATLEQLKASIDIAQEMNLDPVIIHPGSPREDMDPRVVDLFMTTFLQEIADYAAEKEVRVALETCEHCVDLRKLYHYVEKIDSPYLGICMDLSPEVVQANDLDGKGICDFISQVSNRLFHVRLHGLEMEQTAGKFSYDEICSNLIKENYQGTLIFRDVEDVQAESQDESNVTYKVG